MGTQVGFVVVRSHVEYVARCDALSLESTGPSPEAALEALRWAVEQQISAVEAVAPISRPPSQPTIELVPTAWEVLEP